MRIKREVIKKRLVAALAKLDAEEAAVEAQFGAYKDSVVAVYTERLALAQSATNYAELQGRFTTPLPNPPSVSWGHKERKLEIERNLRIVEALEDEFFEVEKMRTGRNFTLDSIFDSII